MNNNDSIIISEFEERYGRLAPGYRRKLLKILDSDTESRNSSLQLLALKAYPSSPIQRLIQDLEAVSRPGLREVLDRKRAEYMGKGAA